MLQFRITQSRIKDNEKRNLYIINLFEESNAIVHFLRIIYATRLKLQ